MLGATVVSRSGESDATLAQQVAQLWGGRHLQNAPTACVERPHEVSEDVQEKDEQGRLHQRRVVRTVVRCEDAPLAASKLDVDLRLEPRRKGLLWYDTYTVAFHGRYRIRNEDAQDRPLVVRFRFPSAEAPYDAFRLSVNGNDASELDAPHGASDNVRSAAVRVMVAAGQDANADVTYRSRGLGDWTYAFGAGGRRAGPRLRPRDEDRLRGHRFPRRHALAHREGTPWDRAGAWAGRFDSLVTGQQHRHGPAEPPEPRPAGRAHHVLRARVAAVLHDRDGDPGRPARAQPPPDELLLPLRRLLRLPPAARLPGRPRRRSTPRSPSPPPPACFLVVSYLRAGRPAAASPCSKPAWRSSSSWCSSATPSSSRASPA